MFRLLPRSSQHFGKAALSSRPLTRGTLFAAAHQQQQLYLPFSSATTTTTTTKSNGVTTTFHLPDPTAPEGGFSTSFTPKLTKIVATIGPTSEQLTPLQQVVQSGMRIMRLNFSHATVEEVELRTNNLKLCQGRHSMLEPGLETSGTDRNVRAVLLDTKGPEIRSGKLQHDLSGKETMKLVKGDTITLHTSLKQRDAGSTPTDLFIDYDQLHTSVTPGMKILLDDGAIILTVLETESNKILDGTVTCQIENTGELRSRAGVNLPGAETALPAMSDKDKVDIRYGMTKDIDFVAASFVQNAAGVREIRAYIEECATELGWPDDHPRPMIISKIESMNALQHFDDILEESDGIMVARGDLGVEIPIQQVTNAQKEMVAACNAVGKPVIVATQMLESMAKNPRPTRAEVADVTNAVYDGADCVMLSGETAKGHYPVESVKMMNEIIESAEQYQCADNISNVATPQRFQPPTPSGTVSADHAIAQAAVAAASQEDATAILVLTKQGTLPPLVSAYRPNVPILTFCPNSKLARQLQIWRAVHPIVVGDRWGSAEDESTEGRPEAAVKDAMAMGFVSSGDNVIIVTMEESEGLGRAATMKIVSVP